MRHRANTSSSYCHLFNAVATAYTGEIVLSGRMRSDGVVKTTLGLLDLDGPLSPILRCPARRP